MCWWDRLSSWFKQRVPWQATGPTLSHLMTSWLSFFFVWDAVWWETYTCWLSCPVGQVMPLRVWSSLFLNHPVGTKVMALFRYLAGDFLQSEIVQLLATGRASILDKNWTVWCNNIASSQNWTLFLSFYIVNRPEVLVNYKDWNKQPDVHKWNKIGLWTWYFGNWTISPECMWKCGLNLYPKALATANVRGLWFVHIYIHIHILILQV